jgi:hypothetical protein
MSYSISMSGIQVGKLQVCYLLKRTVREKFLNLTYAGAGVFGAFSSFPACYFRPLGLDKSASGRRGHFGTASCGLFAEVGWGLGSKRTPWR